MKKLLQLEGIRGIGALIVFTCHFQLTFLPQFYQITADCFKRLMPYSLNLFAINLLDLYLTGEMFVHIFWALSAYVIFRKFFELNTRGETIIEGIIKRYFRLMLPCAFSVVFTYVLLRSGLIYLNSVKPDGIFMSGSRVLPFDLMPSIFYTVKSALWNNIFSFDVEHAINIPLWTIQKEFYGTVFCYCLFGLIGVQKNRSVIYIILFAIVYGLRMYWLNSILFGYYLADFDFSFTAHTSIFYTAAKVINNLILKFQGYAILITVILFVIIRYILFRFPQKMDAVNCLTGFLLVIICLRVNWIKSILKLKPLVSLGKLSFGLYVLHWPVMCSFTCWYYLKSDHISYLNLAILYTMSLIISLILAWLFNKYIDIKSIKLAKKISRYLTTTFEEKAITLS